MSEIDELEIKSMTKEQNYMRGYKDGKSDVLDEIRAEIQDLYVGYRHGYEIMADVLQIIDKYREGEPDEVNN